LVTITPTLLKTILRHSALFVPILINEMVWTSS
jgi:hypothetical protein